MTEHEARNLLLARAAEEAGAFSAPILAAALEDVRLLRPDPERQLIRRAAFLIQRLDPRFMRLCKMPLPPLPLWILAFVIPLGIGFLSSELGPSQRIHAFLNPLALVIVWNVVVYLLLIPFFLSPLGMRLPLPRPAARRSTLRQGLSRRSLQSVAVRVPWRAVLWLVARRYRLPRSIEQVTLDASGHRASTDSPTTSSSKITLRYLGLYVSHCSAALTHRRSALLSLGALGFASGVLAGIYLQAIAFKYTVTWSSTVIGSESVRLALLRILYFPAAIALGEEFPGLEIVNGLATDAGADAAIWLHVFAISAAAYVLVPRMALLARSLVRASQTAARIRVDLDEPFWRDAMNPPIAADEANLTRILLRELGLDAAATLVLRTLQRDMIERDLRASGPKAASRSRSDDKKAWVVRWQAALTEEFAIFPLEQRPILPLENRARFEAALAHLRSSPESTAADVVLLELLNFVPYSALEPEKRGRLLSFRRKPTLDKRVHTESIREAARLLDRSPEQVEELDHAYRQALQELKGGLSLLMKVGAVTAGGTAIAAAAAVGAPLVGGAIGTWWLGFSGIAAVNAGLALLGGGSLAAGGLGVSGGTAALVATGAVLGSSSAASLLKRVTAAEVRGFAAQADTVVRIAIVGRQGDWKRFDSFCSWLTRTTAHLREELPKLRSSTSIRESQIKEHEKILGIYENLSRRLEAWGRARRSQGCPAVAPPVVGV